MIYIHMYIRIYMYVYVCACVLLESGCEMFSASGVGRFKPQQQQQQNGWRSKGHLESSSLFSSSVFFFHRYHDYCLIIVAASAAAAAAFREFFVRQLFAYQQCVGVGKGIPSDSGSGRVPVWCSHRISVRSISANNHISENARRPLWAGLLFSLTSEKDVARVQNFSHTSFPRW